MGSVPRGKGNLGDQRELFSSVEVEARKRESPSLLEASPRGFKQPLKPPDQTNSKSKLICEYIANFQLITRGGLFIDGFSAPQKRDSEEAWTARRVLELEPKRLRRFWLCDLEAEGIRQLRELKAKHDRNPRFRHVSVMEGDFNETIDVILRAGRITPSAAVFAFLDQRNMECHWETVRKIAEFRHRRKIEVMYFLGTGWLLRSIKSARRPEKIEEIDRWWGGDEWRQLEGKRLSEIPDLFANRFVEEFGYQFVKCYPIMMREGERRVAFHLIHASDHAQAPVLMTRAYRKICGELEGSPADAQLNWIDQL